MSLLYNKEFRSSFLVSRFSFWRTEQPSERETRNEKPETGPDVVVHASVFHFPDRGLLRILVSFPLPIRWLGGYCFCKLLLLCSMGSCLFGAGPRRLYVRFLHRPRAR